MCSSVLLLRIQSTIKHLCSLVASSQVGMVRVKRRNSVKRKCLNKKQKRKGTVNAHWCPVTVEAKAPVSLILDPTYLLNLVQHLWNKVISFFSIWMNTRRSAEAYVIVSLLMDHFMKYNSVYIRNLQKCLTSILNYGIKESENITFDTNVK